MFSGLACSSRWTKAYYKRNHVAFQEFQNSELPDSDSVTITTTPRRRRVRILSGQDKYRRTHDLCQKLSSVIAEKSMREFTYHIKNLEQLLDLLSQSKPYAITEVFSCDYEGIVKLIFYHINLNMKITHVCPILRKIPLNLIFYFFTLIFVNFRKSHA